MPNDLPLALPPELALSPGPSLQQLRELEARDKNHLETIGKLSAELVSLKEERDTLQQALLTLLKEEVSFTPEEIADIERNGFTLDEVIQEIEQMPKRK